MRSALPAAVAEALEAALRAGGVEHGSFEVWAVGGAVRDVALGRPVVDLDLASADDPLPLAIAAARALDGRVETHDRFGTASAVGAAGRIDFARLRTETYATPGALPEPSHPATIEADLARRDFSVNAIALCLAGPRRGELLDPHAGLADLEAGRLRVLHGESFRDDATRAWRGARYAARLGLRPDRGTHAALEAGARWLASISGERLWAEFERTAAEPAPLRVLALLDEWGALEGSAPGLRLHANARRALRRRGPLDVAVLAAVVLAPLEGWGAICARFGVPRDVSRAVEETRALLGTREATPEALAGLEGASEAARTAALWLERASQRLLQRELGRWERAKSHLAAAGLQALGVPSGPALGEWLRRLRRERFLGNLHSAAEARRLVRRELADSMKEPP